VFAADRLFAPQDEDREGTVACNQTGCHEVVTSKSKA